MMQGSSATPIICLSSNTAWSIFNFRRGVINAYLARGYRVATIAPPDKFSAQLAQLGCEVHDIRIDNKGTNPWNDIRTTWAYVRLYRKIRPSIALHYTIKPVIYGSLAARFLRIPCINMVTGLGAVFVQEGWVTRLVEWLYRVSQSHPEKIFFLNEEDKRIFLERRLIDEKYAEALPGEGVNLDDFQVSGKAEVLSSGSGVDLAHFEAIQVAQPHTSFILVARMLRDKGVEIFVNAARLLRTHHPDARFLLLGPLGVPSPSAIGKDEMDRWVAEGVVEYLGETADVRPFVRAASCVVLPSYYREGIPKSLMEAAAMAKPIITTDSVGCRDVVEDGVTGLLVQPRDAADLAAKMQAFIALSQSARAEMGAKGRAKMEQQFDEKLVIQRYLDMASQILARSSRNTIGLNSQ